jgi:hypothetical protein
MTFIDNLILNISATYNLYQSNFNYSCNNKSENLIVDKLFHIISLIFIIFYKNIITSTI